LNVVGEDLARENQITQTIYDIETSLSKRKYRDNRPNTSKKEIFKE
jgi:hypothetical protein